MIVIHPWFVLGWILASWVIGLLGRHKRFGFFGNFLISMIFSPLVGLVVLIASERSALAASEFHRSTTRR